MLCLQSIDKLQCMSIITRYDHQKPKSHCNCQDLSFCPFDQWCTIKSVIYAAEVTATADDNTTDNKTNNGLCERICFSSLC